MTAGEARRESPDGHPSGPRRPRNGFGAPVIEARSVTKRFGEFTALDGISLTVHEGEVLVVIGPSGSGKSTLIRCFNGLEDYDEGEIRFSGRRVDANHRSIQDVRRHAGMVFQDYNLFPHLTILQNVALFPQRVHGLSRKDAEAVAMEELRRLRIPEQAHKYPGALSGGQRQRAGIARALATKPRCVLFDEPTAALDPEMVREVLDAMLELAKSGMTMVVVTHEMPFARSVANRVAYLEGGKLVEIDHPENLFSNAQEERTRRFLSLVT